MQARQTGPTAIDERRKENSFVHLQHGHDSEEVEREMGWHEKELYVRGCIER